MTAAKKYDCRTCGACCVSEYDSDIYVQLKPGDQERLTKAQRKRLVVLGQTPGTAYLRTKTERSRAAHVVCALHIGVVGKTSRCGIYERRPEICSEFEPGSRACRIAREDAGLPTK